MRVFVTGATGLIGTRLVKHLHERQDDVIVLTRRPEVVKKRIGNSCTIIAGDPTQLNTWMLEVDRCEAVINLAGENIFNHRWTAKFKTQMRDSRVKGTTNLVQALARNPFRSNGSSKVLINASAIGYYGSHGDEEVIEASQPGSDFLARLCVDWEQAARAAVPLGVRVALIRTGIVLDSEGGALPQILTLFKYFLGGPVGSGRQWMSWIHHQDLIELYLLALDNQQAKGPINGTAPAPVTNRSFVQALGKILHRPSFLPTPKFALRLMLGEVAEVISTGQRVLPRQPALLDYSFRFPELEGALKDLLSDH